MAIVSFNATARDQAGKGAARTLRSKGFIPAVIYGHGRDPQALSLNARDLDKLLGHIQAESTVIEVSVGGTTSKRVGSPRFQPDSARKWATLPITSALLR